jgi:hypothetical protein
MLQDSVRDMIPSKQTYESQLSHIFTDAKNLKNNLQWSQVSYLVSLSPGNASDGKRLLEDLHRGLLAGFCAITGQTVRGRMDQSVEGDPGSSKKRRLQGHAAIH